MAHILFLYANEHSGHKKAAEAIQKSLNNLNPKIETSGIGFFSHHYPVLGPLLFKLYVDLARSIPNVWDYLYNSHDIAALTADLRMFFNSLNVPKLNETISKIKPDLIVCTQAIPCGFIAGEKKKQNLKIPLMSAITDFVANPYWPDHNVDCYCVPDDEIKDELTERGISDRLIKVTGIPIDGSFAKKMPKEEARLKLGLNKNIPTVLVMGGNHGLGHISTAVKKLSKLKSNFQTIVVTGYNHQLYRKLKKSCSKKKNILILDHVKNISKIMDASDLLISKPGGITSSEAVTKMLPMIVLSPLPGQEQKNALFLKKHGVAEMCDNINRLGSVVESFIHNKSKMKKFHANAMKISRPYASNSIAEQIMKRVNLANIPSGSNFYH